jgi:single-stranded-DNA-specific exonuclease
MDSRLDIDQVADFISGVGHVPEISLPISKKNWVLLPHVHEDELVELNSVQGLHPTVAILLAQRGILDEASLKRHFNPTLEDLHDPFLMADMDKAVSRILSAFEKNERIMIFGDYDVDGTTSVSLVYKYLLKYYTNLECYIPDRYAEGYGISTKGIDTAKENGVSLIIALDCGIKSIDKVNYAKDLGIDFVICDHHLPGEFIPEAFAVLDPKRVDCKYPYNELSGCGVGFKLMQALASHEGWPEEELFDFLDLVAVSIGSDIVPITGENRILMHFGLEKVNKKPSPGIEALLQIGGFKTNVDGHYTLKVDRLVFGIGPRINAAGRIGHGFGAVQLLTSETLEQALSFVGKVDDQNIERKEIDKNITEEAMVLIASTQESTDAFSTVLFQPHWHKGVIGIVASRCIEHFYRPTIILTEFEGKLTGSARSVFGFDMYNALDACSEHLIQFGGHYFAAGLTLYPEKLEDFKKAFEMQVQAVLTKDQLKPRVVIDAAIELPQIKGNLLRQIQRMGPFGPQNMNPLFMAYGVRNTGLSRLLENKNGGQGHIKFSITIDGFEFEGQPLALDGIGFSLGEFWPIVDSGMPFDIAFHIEENDFRDKKTLQLVIKEIRINEVV